LIWENARRLLARLCGMAVSAALVAACAVDAVQLAVRGSSLNLRMVGRKPRPDGNP
jgi:hypothetical protein